MTWAPVIPYGCPRVCEHGKTGACTHPEVAGRLPGATVPFDDARAQGGACGPDAEHMTFPGLQHPLPGAWREARR